MSGVSHFSRGTCLPLTKTRATVVQQLLNEISNFQNAAPIVYFYCQRNTAQPQRSEPAEVLRAVLKQIVCWKARWQIDSTTAREYRRRKLEANKDGSEIERLDITETTQKIIDAVEETPVTILIDAVDECDSEQRYQLLRALDILLEDSAHLVKVFVSSRDDADIVLKLQKHPNIYIDVYDNQHDINRFVKAEIQKARSDGRLLKGTTSSELETLITENLARKAGGMFLWVSLQIESLCDSRRIKIEGDLVDELDRLPQSLAGMYSLILENIGQIEHRGRTVAESTFRWLLCTKDARSLVTIAACSGTISTDHRSLSVEDILDVCSTLVVYDKELDSFRFAHLSVREFLESQPSYTASEANRSVLERSLLTLICHKPSEDPFWFYATLYWILHYERLEKHRRKEVFERHAKRFLFNGAEPSDAFKTWVTDANRPGVRLLRSELVLPSSESTFSPDDIFMMHIISSYQEDIQGPVVLASCLGWLEVLDHLRTNQSPDAFHGVAMGITKVAIHFRQSSVVRWLFDQNFYPTDEHLELAFQLSRSEIVQTFLDLEVLSIDTLINGREILVLAVRSGLWDIYRDLIKKGANVYCRDRDGRTLLSHAVSNASKNSDFVEDLLLTGIDPTAQDNAGRTSLSLSIWDGYQPRSSSSLRSQIIKIARSGFDKEVLGHALQSYDYHTACLLLHYRLDSMLEDVDMYAEWMEILNLIATTPTFQSDASASVTKRSAKVTNHPEDQMQLAGQTLLDLAALFDHEKAFKVLLDLGIDPTCAAICEIRKKTSTFAQMGHSMSRQEPWDQKSGNNNKMSDELRQGPLAWAAYTGNLPVVQSILDRGLDPNIKNRKGQTALYFAVKQTGDKYSRIDMETDKEAIVRLLLRKGALVASVDVYGGATLLAQAFTARYSKVARLLLENGAKMPEGALAGPMEQVWGAFHQGQEGIRKALLERIQGAQVVSSDLQPSSPDLCWSGDALGIAARLMLGGTMRVLGDMLPTI